MSEEDINFLISIQDLEQPEFDNACLERENERLRNKLQQKENTIKEVREEIIKYKEIMENGIEQGAYYSYLGSLQQKLDKFLEILDKGE